MRILFIHNQYQQQGGEDVAVQLETEILRENGHEVKSIIFQNTSPLGFQDKLNTSVKAIYNSDSYEIVRDEIDAFKPDLVHAHNLFFVASPSVLFATRKKRIPVILTLHNYRLLCANALLLRDGKVCELCVHKTFPLSGIKYKCYHRSRAESAVVTTITATHKMIGTWKNKIDRFIVLTEFAKTKFLGTSLDVGDQKMVVKPNFIPDPGMGLAEREDFFLFVGRLSEEKGINVLLEAFSSIHGQRLVVIGDGPLKSSIEARFLETSNIMVKGSMSKAEVMDIMKRCKALIFPSTWYEGLPFVILEAFATGTPVIASNLGSMKELIEDGRNGYHFIPGDVMDLQKKINLFLQTGRHERQLLYDYARSSYLNKFDPKTHYKAILSVYEKVIAGK